MLDEKFIEKQKLSLLKEKMRLEGEIAKVKKFPESGHSDDDNSQEVEEFEEYRGLESQFRTELADVNLALHKIEDGTYGYCQNCHKPIGLDRLEAYPAATTCIKCDN